MDVLPIHFRTLWVFGIWHEETEKLNVLRVIYRLAIISLVFYFTFTLTAELFVETSDVSDFTESMFLSVTYITLCMKICNFIFRRTEMIDILKDFRHPYCKSNDDREVEILEKHSKTARNVFIYLLICIFADFSHFVMIFVLQLISGAVELPFTAYQFYNVTSQQALIPTAVLQLISAISSATINIAFDTMTAGFLMLLTGQLEINAYRFSKLTQDSVDSMNDFIAHNALINGTIDKIESFIIGIVIPFLLFSLLSVCATVFKLSELSIFSLEFVGLLFFALCILLQVLLYCWFGNELMLKSEAVANAVYNSDWVALSPENRRTLQITMMCNKNGRVISYGGQGPLTLETFIWILKTAYAMISLLQQMDNK